MTVITFDTLKFARTLEDAGVPTEQATVHARALADALSDDMVTKSHLDIRLAEVKSELSGLRHDIREQESRMTIKLGGMLVVLAGVILTAMKMFAG
jgi:hypothetical protein